MSHSTKCSLLVFASFVFSVFQGRNGARLHPQRPGYLALDFARNIVAW